MMVLCFAITLKVIKLPLVLTANALGLGPVDRNLDYPFAATHMKRIRTNTLYNLNWAAFFLIYHG